jgi:hypothetical protein
MRGHQPLIAMRLKHRKPTFVSVDVGVNPKWLCDHWHEQGLQPHLLIEPSDPIDRLDLRFLVGLSLVHISGHVDDEARVRKAYDACVNAGVDRVIGGLHRKQGEEIHMVEYFDTAGVLTWPE